MPTLVLTPGRDKQQEEKMMKTDSRLSATRQISAFFQTSPSVVQNSMKRQPFPSLFFKGIKGKVRSLLFNN